MQAAEAPHLPPMRAVPDSKEAAEWHAYDKNGELEQVLGTGAIALIDAHWLVHKVQSEPSWRFQRRQDLPDEAFMSLAELKAQWGTSGRACA